MIKFVPLGEFVPDAPRYGSQALDHVENLAPSFGGYRSVRKKETRTVELAPSSDRAINGAIASIYLESTSEQKQRPSGTSSNTFWRSNSEHTQDDLHELIDGASPSDTEYIVAGGGETAAIEIELPEFRTPASTTGWKVRIRWQVQEHETGTWSLTYTLLDGATTLRGPITIDSDTTTDSGGWATYEDSFTGNLSWDLDDLRIQIDSVVDGPDVDVQPDSDESNPGLWTTEAGSTSSLHSSINEDSADDNDYVRSPRLKNTGSDPKVTFGFPDIDDPLAYYPNSYSPAPFVPRYRMRVPHDNIVPNYRVLHADDSVAREGDITLTNSATFSTEAKSINMGDVEDFEGMRIELGGTITDEWKNAEGTSGTAEPDLYENHFPTSLTHDVLFWSGAYTDVDDVSGDGDYVALTIPGPTVPSTKPSAVFNLGNYQHPGIDFGTTVTARVRRLGSAVTMTMYIEDSLANVIDQESFTISDTSFTDYTMSLDTTSVMQAIEAEGTGGIYIRLEFPARTVQSQEISSVYLNSPEQARVFCSQLEIRHRADARASVSWVEMEVPSSSDGYVDDDITIYGGDLDSLYTVSDSGFTDVSGTTYGSGSELPRPWSFAVWGNDVIATNYVDPVQIRTDGSGNFGDLITSTNQPKARFVAPVRNQVFLAHLQDDGGEADMVWWSAIDDASDFDPDLSTLCDSQALRDTQGQITGFVGGQYATIFKRNSITRADFVGLPTIYEFRVISHGIGTPYPRSIVQVGEDIYFYAEGGFAVLRGGSRVQYLGDETVSRFLADNDFSPYALRLVDDQDAFDDLALFGAYDPHSRLIFWFYAGPNSFMFEDSTSPSTIRSAVHNDVIVYDTRTGKFGYMNLLRGLSQGDPAANATAALNLVNPSPSNTSWTRGVGVFGWDRGTDHGGASGMASTYFQFDDEEVYPSAVNTKVFTLAEGRDSTVNRIRPIFTAIPEGVADPTVTVTLSSAQDPHMLTNKRDVVYSDQDSDGWYLERNTGEFMQLSLEFDPSNDEFIRELQGFQLDFEVEGGR